VYGLRDGAGRIPRRKAVHPERRIVVNRHVHALLSLVVGFALTTPALGRPQAGSPERERKRPKAPRIGEVAPSLTLARLEAREKKVELDMTQRKDQKPLVLIFGSYT